MTDPIVYAHTVACDACEPINKDALTHPTGYLTDETKPTINVIDQDAVYNGPSWSD